MKLFMSSLDIMVCARELKNAIGARVDDVQVGQCFSPAAAPAKRAPRFAPRAGLQDKGNIERAASR